MADQSTDTLVGGDERLARAQTHADEEMPRAPLTRRALIASGIFVVGSLALFYFVVPKLAGLSRTWDRINQGQPVWLAIAAILELLSFVGYMALFRAVFARGTTRIHWRETYQITMAGLAATRLFAAAGAGGIALTAWAMRRAGMEAREVAVRLVAFNVLLYAVFMGWLVIGGIGLRTRVLPGTAPLGFTVIPAVFGGIVVVLVLAISALPAGFERRMHEGAKGSTRLARILARLASVPAAVADGTREAIRLLRTRDPSLLGAIGWWGFDAAVLWACFHAFGQPPPWPVILMAYFVGMLGNLLPLPGGIGGVDGGMIAAFIAFGVSGSLAFVAVISYRAFAFWLPTIPGAIAYLQLRRTVKEWRAEPTGDAAVA